MIGFGDTVKDCVTGFCGVAVERVEYIAGGVMWGIQPRLSEEGELQEVQYFPEERLILSLKELRSIKSGN
jgi:hypothetical protein